MGTSWKTYWSNCWSIGNHAPNSMLNLVMLIQYSVLKVTETKATLELVENSHHVQLSVLPSNEKGVGGGRHHSQLALHWSKGSSRRTNLLCQLAINEMGLLRLPRKPSRCKSPYSSTFCFAGVFSCNLGQAICTVVVNSVNPLQPPL